MKKFFGLVAALLAVSLVSFGFVACSDDDDDDPSVVASYKATASDGTYTLDAYDDNSWVLTVSAEGYTNVGAKGTYTLSDGNFTDGTIAIVMTHSWDDDEDKLVEETKNLGSVEIKSGKFTINFGENLEFTKQ